MIIILLILLLLLLLLLPHQRHCCQSPGDQRRSQNPRRTKHSAEHALNKALRVTTGWYNMTNIDYLHNESRVLPINEHTNMLVQLHAVFTNQQTSPTSTTDETRPVL